MLEISITVRGATLPLLFRSGLSTIVVGANGSGKTALAVQCERELGGIAHRISAQRMLSLNPSIHKTSEDTARGELRYGNGNWGGVDPQKIRGLESMRVIHRWKSNGPEFILNDGGFLLQLLFAEQANVAVRVYNAHINGIALPHDVTCLYKLSDVFNKVLPNRHLSITADNIMVSSIHDGAPSEPYRMLAMSDGEKAVFYMIGQALVAARDSVLIMDEPEIHIHRSILARLWDELEALRPDCAFLLITHDLEFAASRSGNKYLVRSYAPTSGWIIDSVPEAEGFSEDIVTLILGSRRPVLFVEGEQGSLDIAFYRSCYPDWTIVPRGGCESVIHSVVTLRRNTAFTRIHCAGLVDADGHDDNDREYLASKGISVLPVSEIENLLLLPTVSRAILEMNDFHGSELDEKLTKLRTAIFADAANEKNVHSVALRYCQRRIDKTLKQIDLSSSASLEDLVSNYERKTKSLDIAELATSIKRQVETAILEDNLDSLLSIYDRKRPLLALAASHLRNLNVETFISWVMRAIQSKHDDRLRNVIRNILPRITTPDTER